jgi:hypothetical protein
VAAILLIVAGVVIAADVLAVSLCLAASRADRALDTQWRSGWPQRARNGAERRG